MLSCIDITIKRSKTPYLFIPCSCWLAILVNNYTISFKDTREGIPPSVSDDLPQRVDSLPAYGNQDPPQINQDLPSLDSSTEDQDGDSHTIQLLEPDNGTNSNTRKCYKDCFSNTRKCCKDCFRKCCKDCTCFLVTKLSCILSFILMVIFFVIFLLLLILSLHIYMLPSGGEVLMGNNDVVQAVTLDPSNFSKVNFILDPFNITIGFYHDSCSEIQVNRSDNTYVGQLSTIDNMQYVIDQTYVVSGSLVTFIFSSSNSSSLDSSTCIASIPVFRTYSDFTAFLASGLIANAIALHCLPPASSITFNVLAYHQNFYNFVGLKGYESATINYTVIKDVNRYNVTFMTATSCMFPAQTCSIPLDQYHQGDVCILAYLQSKDLLSLNFRLERNSSLIAEATFSWIALASSVIALLICLMSCCIYVKDIDNDKATCINPRVCCKCIFIGISILGIPIGIGLLIGLTRPALPSGGILIGNNDVVLATTPKTYVSRTNFSYNASILSDVIFYYDKCSEIPIKNIYQNCSQQLNTTSNMQYIVDQAYMIKGSEILYAFSSNVSSTSSDSCVASIPVFHTYNDFTAFLASGLIARANVSYCLPPASSITFTLSASDNLHYFVGIQSFQSSVINYTMQGNIREYDVTNMTTTVCTFPSSSCSIDNPPGGQDMCILTSLQLSDTFVTLNYTSEGSDRYWAQLIFAVIIPIVLSMIVLIIIIIKYYYSVSNS